MTTKHSGLISQLALPLKDQERAPTLTEQGEEAILADQHYDLIVIEGVPVGQQCAINAAKLGKEHRPERLKSLPSVFEDQG